jgi:general secretion pathway protein C
LSENWKKDALQRDLKHLGILLKKYLWVAYLVGVMFCSYFLAKMVTTLIADRLILERKFTLSQSSQDVSLPTKTLASFDQYKVILDRNIFDSKVVTTPVTEVATPETPNLEGPAVKTNLPIKLLSTFSVGSGVDQRSTATIVSSSSAKGGTADVYTVGDEKQFSPGVKITKILPDRIEFINGAHLEYVEIENLAAMNVSTGSPLSKLEGSAATKPGGPNVAKQEDGKFVIDQAEIDNAMNNLDKLFTEVRAVPNFVGGKPAGIKLLSMTSSSLFAKLGLQRGDVIERINGVDIDMKRGFEIFNQLKGEKRITIDLNRNGAKQTLDYEIR